MQTRETDGEHTRARVFINDICGRHGHQKGLEKNNVIVVGQAAIERQRQE